MYSGPVQQSAFAITASQPGPAPSKEQAGFGSGHISQLGRLYRHGELGSQLQTNFNQLDSNSYDPDDDFSYSEDVAEDVAATQHPKKGFSSVIENLASGATVWGAHHLPQNRNFCLVGSADGTLYIYKYHYPDQRKVKDHEGLGVAGSMELLASRNFSTRPIGGFRARAL
eukprot:gene30593-35604_t